MNKVTLRLYFYLIRTSNEIDTFKKQYSIILNLSVFALLRFSIGYHPVAERRHGHFGKYEIGDKNNS